MRPGDERLADLVDEVDERDDEEHSGGGEEDDRRPSRHAIVETGLHQDRSGQRHQSVDDHEDQSEQQRPAELTQQPQQAEAPVRTRLALEVDRGDVTHRSQTRDAGEQLGSRRQVEPPAGPATAEPGAEGRRAEGRRGGSAAGWRRSPAHADAVMPSRPAAAIVASASMESPASRVELLEPGYQRPVQRASGDELVVGALLDDDPAIEHHDPVGQMQRRLTVRDQQRRATGHDTAERVVHRRLDPRVDRAGGVVEDEDARVVEDRSRERDPLALTARQGQAALADRGVVSARQLRR